MLADPTYAKARGRFDPLTLEAAQWLAQMRTAALGLERLLVIVDDVEGTLLPALDRARLVGALRVVDAVVIAPPGEFANAKIQKNYEGDRQRTAAFIRRIVTAQSHDI